MSRLFPALLAALACAACSAGVTASPDMGARADAGGSSGAVDGGASGDGGFVCPVDGIGGAGRHRLFIQGREAPPRADGTWPFLHEPEGPGLDAQLCDDTVFVTDANGNGQWDIGESPLALGPSALVHGEHFLVGSGAFVEFTTTLCEDITGEVTLYIPNFDADGSVTLHQLFVVHDGTETLVAEATDDEPGTSGYNPFVRIVSGVDPDVVPGDTLLLRSTNISGVVFSVMVWRPPSQYESWIVVEVP